MKLFFQKLMISISIISSFPLVASEDSSVSNQYPWPLIGVNKYFGHHIIIAEKSKHLLHLFKNENGYPQIVKSFPMATGKVSGNKMSQGDYRTPEGVYYLTEFIPRNKLLKAFGKNGEIYGIGAFVLNYPNPVDKIKGKSGSGIWIHSTNDETRIEKGLDSRGCIVISNTDLKELSTYIELNKTNVIVVNDLYPISNETLKMKKNILTSFIDSWMKSWTKKDAKQYFQHYSQNNYRDENRKSFEKFVIYKNTVFAGSFFPEIKANNISFLDFGDYVVVTFIQDYKSPRVNTKGRKTLYLMRDESNEWKIVREQWNTQRPQAHSNVTNLPMVKYF